MIAEDREGGLLSYLGLRYPASDIPPQARRLYLLNTLRLKADVTAPNAALVPVVNPLTGTALDMTVCILRAMSPVHVEYLRNMGVGASLSISIVIKGKLWGLIACHHHEGRFVPNPVRITCEVLTRLFSYQISAAEDEQERAYAVALVALSYRIRNTMQVDRRVGSVLMQTANDLVTFLHAHGCAFSIGGETRPFGITPGQLLVDKLLDWLRINQSNSVFSTERMADLFPHQSGFLSPVSGLLSLRISPTSMDFILWFRRPVVEVVNWAGNPATAKVESETGHRIGPRKSFEKWKEISQDKSSPWGKADRQFAEALRPVIAETLLLEMNEEIVRLNAELTRSNDDLSSFAYRVSHDLKESVRTIRMSAQMVARRVGHELDAESKTLVTFIEGGAERMGSLIASLLSYAEVGGGLNDNREAVKLADVLNQVMLNLDSRIRETGATITHNKLPVVFAEKEYMVQLLQNLIENALKYRRAESTPLIHVTAERQSGSWCFSVRDNGQGFLPVHKNTIFEVFKRLHGREVPGTGIGLATCKRIVESHNGEIWAESEGINQGATFRFTLRGSNPDFEAAS